MITTVDNREAYKKREHALRFQQPYAQFGLSTLSFYERVSREVKRRRSLKNED